LKESIRKYEDMIRELNTHQEFLKKELVLRDNKIRELEELIKRQRSEVYKQLKKDKIMKIRDTDIQSLQNRYREEQENFRIKMTGSIN